MKFTSIALTASCFTASVMAFAPSTSINRNRNLEPFHLHATDDDDAHNYNHNHVNDIIHTIQKNVKGAAAATFLAGAIWASPAAILGNYNDHSIIANPLFNQIQSSVVADAKEMASGSGSRVNKDPESLLRLGLPIPKDKEVSR
jgi:nicotinamide mononucleotide adenylyltransferase